MQIFLIFDRRYLICDVAIQNMNINNVEHRQKTVNVIQALTSS